MRGVSAITSNERLREMMSEPYRRIQVAGPDGNDNTLTHQTGDD